MKSKTSLSVFQTYFTELYHSYLTRFGEDSFVQNQIVLTQTKFAVSSPRCMSVEQITKSASKAIECEMSFIQSI